MIAAHPISISTRCLRAFFTITVCFTVLLAMGSPTSAQKEKKKKKDAKASDNANFKLPMPDEQQIDYTISEMLGAWQLGDTDRLHKYYADDAVFVSGTWAPPVFGWSNYLALYQQQRARLQQVRLDRLNTFVKVSGSVAWATYQWDFSGRVDGQLMTSQGHTTLVFEKRNDQWLIVHNHTSLVQPPPSTSGQPTPAVTPQPQSGKPPAQ